MQFFTAWIYFLMFFLLHPLNRDIKIYLSKDIFPLIIIIIRFDWVGKRIGIDYKSITFAAMILIFFDVWNNLDVVVFFISAWAKQNRLINKCLVHNVKKSSLSKDRISGQHSIF